MQIQLDSITLLQNEALQKAAHSFGHAYTFNNRARFYAFWLNLIKLFGILLPAIAGLTYTQFGKINALDYLLWAVSLALFILSTLAFAFKWDDELAYCYEASQNYNTLFEEFKKLWLFPEEDLSVLDRKYTLLNANYGFRQQQDAKHDITEKERRKAMRWQLREFQLICVGCNEVPQSMEATNCPVCGKF
jgi:mobilome CxxCx(11)CxxC protein